MLTDERRSKRHLGAASMQLHGSARPTAGCSARASELSNLACRLRPAGRTTGRRVMAEHV
eukprot:scaffold36081_cov63-Phaeocystis_antarctica.AAC.1